MNQPKSKYLAGKGTPPESFQAAAARRLQGMNKPTAHTGKKKALGAK